MSLSAGSNYSIMQKSLDAMWLKLKVISDNIANVDTPGYTAKTVDFEEILMQKLKASDSQSEMEQNIDNINPKIKDDNTATVREDGNNVDIDAQNIELARTQIQYEYMTRMISSTIARQKYVISEGRR